MALCPIAPDSSSRIGCENNARKFLSHTVNESGGLRKTALPAENQTFKPQTSTTEYISPRFSLFSTRSTRLKNNHGILAQLSFSRAGERIRTAAARRPYRLKIYALIVQPSEGTNPAVWGKPPYRLVANPNELLPTTIYQLPSTNYHLSTTNYQLRIKNKPPTGEASAVGGFCATGNIERALIPTRWSPGASG